MPLKPWRPSGASAGQDAGGLIARRNDVMFASRHAAANHEERRSMSRFIGFFAAALVFSAVVVSPGTPASATGRQLYGSFGPGFTIHLLEDGPNGDPVTSLRPGIYWLTVHDTSAIHNFHVFGTDDGATLDEVVTSTAFVGDVTVKLLLKAGDYTFQCDPHASIGMKGAFTVGGVGQLDED
jgi:copper binding plastocyanin/azurin family protein